MDFHEDLAGNVATQWGYDFAGNDAQPFDGAGDDHGESDKSGAPLHLPARPSAGASPLAHAAPCSRPAPA